MKYELTGNTKEINGTRLYQIKSLKDFGDVKTGDLGGWIEKESNLSQAGLCWVSGDARVYGKAQVYGNAWVYGDVWVSGDARVYENAWVFGKARVYDDARVFGKARVYGDVWVYENARVFGNAEVYGNALVYGDAQVSENAWVFGNVEVSGDASVYGNASVYGDARVYGDALVYGDAQVSENAEVFGNVEVYGDARVSGDVKLNMDVKSKSTTTKITAKDALELAKSKNLNLKVDNAVNTLLDRVKQAAEKGQYHIETRDYEFGSGRCYTDENDYPAICKQILKELRALGFECGMRMRDQFADVWLEISWEDD